MKDKQGPKAAASKRRWYDNNKEYVKQQASEKTASMRRFVAAVKSYPCEDCSQSFPPCVMQFDHRDPSKKEDNVARIVKNGSWSKLQEEILKCDLVCANCHAIRTHMPS